VKTALRKMGNSQGLIIPKPLLAELGLSANDAVDMKVKKGKLVVTPLKNAADPRAGWAAECKALAEAGEDGLLWPEFGNDDDDKLVW
jgi:antitoxin MazE